jgi:uncharacterized membrane protein HdeD (DUF308 family)
MAVALTMGPWWAFVIRGVLAILFGVLAFALPRMALFTLVVLFGVYALAEGILNLAAGLQGEAPRRAPRWALVLAGVVSILAGFLAFVAPGLTALSLLYVIAAWSIVRGALEIAAAIALRKELEGEWLLAAGGVLSIGFGVVIAAFPGAGALALVLWIGAYAIVFGALLVAVGLKLRRRTRSTPPGDFHELAHGTTR